MRLFETKCVREAGNVGDERFGHYFCSVVLSLDSTFES